MQNNYVVVVAQGGSVARSSARLRWGLPLRACLGVVAVVAHASVLAGPPDAGTLLQQVPPLPLPPAVSDQRVLPEEAARPAAALDDIVPIKIREFRFTGEQAISESKLQTLLSEAVGQTLTLSGIDSFVQKVTQHYRDAGYLLARAYLPVQEIRDGVIEVSILEGRLGRRSLENRSKLHGSLASAYLEGLREGKPLRGDELERDLLLLSDLPGVEVSSTLKPGTSVGTTDLDIRLNEGKAINGTLEADNYGGRSTGVERLGGSINVGNLTGFGDSVTMRIMGAKRMAYARLAWQLPVGGAGTQVGVAWSEMRYRVGEEFARLDAHGRAEIGSLYLLQPLLRSRNSNINGQLLYDHKRLVDDVDATATRARKSVDVYTAGISGNRVDALLGGGHSQASLTYTVGRLRLDDINDALDRRGHKTAGSYSKWNLSVSRQQQLGGNWSLAAALRTQWAGKNLDSSEKMGLGGPNGVRAYPQGEAFCDDGWLMSFDLRYRLLGNWQAGLFYDKGEGRVSHRPLAFDRSNHRHLAGHGLGLIYAGGDFNIQATVAWRDTDAPTSDADHRPRAWIQALKFF